MIQCFSIQFNILSALSKRDLLVVALLLGLLQLRLRLLLRLTCAAGVVGLRRVSVARGSGAVSGGERAGSATSWILGNFMQFLLQK